MRTNTKIIQQNNEVVSIVKEFEHILKDRAGYLKKANRPVVAWSSIYTPEEVLYAGGIMPFRLTGENRPESSKSRAIMSGGVCPYVLSCLEEGVKGTYESLKGIVLVNTCDARRRLYDAWRFYVKTPFVYIIDLPKMTTSDSIEYFTKEVSLFKAAIEQHFKCKIDKRSLETSIAIYNETRTLLSQLYELRKQENAPISGVTTLSVIKAAMIMEKNVFNDNLRRLLKSLRNSGPSSIVKKQRILITGSYFDQTSLIELVEQAGAVVVCEDLSTGIKYFEGNIGTNEEPIRALARYYLMKLPCARMVDSETRFKNILKLVKAYKADSVIYFSLKYCDSNLIDFPYQKNRLEQNGIPVLFLEGERTSINMGQLKTRIQAFLEMNGGL